MYDTFVPFIEVKKYNFIFKPKRFEIWMNGKMVDNGNTNSIIKGEVINVDLHELVEVTFNDVSLHGELTQKNLFDEFSSLNDRLILITVPQETNASNSFLDMRRITSGATRQRKNFDRNEPFACNLFFMNKNIHLVTFSFSNPEKLIEFYS